VVINFGVVQIATDVKRAARLAKRVWRGRKAYSSVSQIQRQRGQLPQSRFEIGVYFADSDVNIYQMRQWYLPLQKLSETYPVVVLARNAIGAKTLFAESGLAVQYVPKVSDLERVLDEQPLKIIFYVNQNTRNFQMMRYGQRWHVFINHGESDKMYMVSNQHKAYDYALVAGDAAQSRLSRTIWNYDVPKRTMKIGRPQADYFYGDAPYPDDDRTTVLYAPTWEGDRPAAAYGSVASHGETIVQKLLATGRHRLIYRPHPRSGVVDSEFGRANKRIIAMIAAANAADGSAHHVYDDSASIGWQLRLPDVAICDVSAMVYDRLATGKPLMVARPAHAEADIDEGGFLQSCEWIRVEDTENIVDELDRVVHDDSAREEVAKWAEYYFGDTTLGVPTKRFHDAVAELLERYNQHVQQ
jgi:hypothetical protein